MHCRLQLQTHLNRICKQLLERLHLRRPRHKVQWDAWCLPEKRQAILHHLGLCSFHCNQKWVKTCVQGILYFLDWYSLIFHRIFLGSMDYLTGEVPKMVLFDPMTHSVKQYVLIFNYRNLTWLLRRLFTNKSAGAPTRVISEPKEFRTTLATTASPQSVRRWYSTMMTSKLPSKNGLLSTRIPLLIRLSRS